MKLPVQFVAPPPVCSVSMVKPLASKVPWGEPLHSLPFALSQSGEVAFPFLSKLNGSALEP